MPKLSFAIEVTFTEISASFTTNLPFYFSGYPPCLLLGLGIIVTDVLFSLFYVSCGYYTGDEPIFLTSSTTNTFMVKLPYFAFWYTHNLL